MSRDGPADSLAGWVGRGVALAAAGAGELVSRGVAEASGVRVAVGVGRRGFAVLVARGVLVARRVAVGRRAVGVRGTATVAEGAEVEVAAGVRLGGGVPVALGVAVAAGAVPVAAGVGAATVAEGVAENSAVGVSLVGDGVSVAVAHSAGSQVGVGEAVACWGTAGPPTAHAGRASANKPTPISPTRKSRHIRGL